MGYLVFPHPVQQNYTLFPFLLVRKNQFKNKLKNKRENTNPESEDSVVPSSAYAVGMISIALGDFSTDVVFVLGDDVFVVLAFFTRIISIGIVSCHMGSPSFS